MTTLHKSNDKASALLSERAGNNYPIWFRAPLRGPEQFTGFGRAKLYALVSQGLIRSVSIRQPGQVKGTRLFHLQSVLDYIASCEVTPATPAGDTPDANPQPAAQ